MGLLSCIDNKKFEIDLIVSVTDRISTYGAGQQLAEWADVIDIICVTTERSFVLISN